MKKNIIESIIVLVMAVAMILVGIYKTPDPRYGWAKRIEDKTVIVSVFADDNIYKWGDEITDEMFYTAEYLDIAMEFLGRQLRRYGHETEYVYDWNKYLTGGNDVDHELFQRAYFDVPLVGDKVDTKVIDEYMNSPAAMKNKLLGKYNAENIIYLFFINTPTYNEYSSTAYMWMQEGDPENEFVLMYNNVNFAKEGPTAYLHEILHCFGAVDLYKPNGNGYDIPISEEYITKLIIRQSNDIMFSVYESREGYVNYDRVTGEFSDVDAYYTGLLDHCDEVEEFGLGKSIYNLE